MAREAIGEVYRTGDGLMARITLQGRQRKSYALLTCKTDAEAEERTALLADLARKFRKAGVIHSPDARKLLETAAGCNKALVAGVMQVAGELVGGELIDRSANDAPTFGELWRQWTSGKLHERYRDHVHAKKTSDLDETRLKMVGQIVVSGVKVDDIPLDQLTVDHADEIMRHLPKSARRPATRRQYAQLVNRVMGLAVYPCRIIKVNPLPRGWVPKPGKPPAYPYLYPDEDRRLLACAAVPLHYRVYWGFLNREGCRTSEALSMRLGHELDLDRGVVKLDANKTDDPRAWALGADVVRALRRHCELRGIKRGDLVFVRPDVTNQARLYRSHLMQSGVDRVELHEKGANWGMMRAHDLRGTFVTLALASGRTETWVADRTGHRSSQMINRYRKASRSASELALGWLEPMEHAIPELADRQGERSVTTGLPTDCPESSTNSVKNSSRNSIKQGKAEVAELADAADSKGAPSQAFSANQHKTSPTSEPEAPTEAPSWVTDGQSDPIESALLDSLQKATAAGEWSAVAALAHELGELRRQRDAVATVTDLTEARKRKGSG
jgi:integrase